MSKHYFLPGGKICKLLERKEMVEGVRVKLVNPDESYTIGEGNPVVGSEYECAGEIVEGFNGDTCEVTWDNGSYNTYKEFELAYDWSSEAEGNLVNIWNTI